MVLTADKSNLLQLEVRGVTEIWSSKAWPKWIGLNDPPMTSNAKPNGLDASE